VRGYPQILIWVSCYVAATGSLTGVNTSDAGLSLFRNAQAFPRMLQGQATVLTAEQLRDAGVSPTAASWRARHGALIRAHHGAYLLGVTQPDLLDRIHAALVVSPPDAVIGFHTAAALLGFGVIEHADVHIVVPSGCVLPQRFGIRAHQSVVPIPEPVTPLGIPCSPAARTAIDLARVLRRWLAVPVLDAALAAGACSADELATEVARHDGLPGVRRARRLIGLADDRSQCVQESQLRLVLHDAGLVGFEPQVPVPDDRYPRYVLDLADRKYRVAAEYDGASHLDRARHRADRERHNWLDGRGWRMRYFTDDDLYRRPDRIVRTLRVALDGR